MMGVLILTNAVTFGAESSADLAGERDTARILRGVDKFFTVVYTLELSMRFFAHGVRTNFPAPCGSGTLTQ